MARKREDSMDHAGSTIPNAEQTPQQDTSASGSDAGEMELLYVWINQDETGYIQEQGFNFSPNYRFEMKKAEDGQKYELSCTETPNTYNLWNTGSIINLTAIVGENGSGKSSLMRHLSHASILPINTVEASSGRILQNTECDYAKMIQIYLRNNSVYVFHNFTDSVVINNEKYHVISINDYYPTAKNMLRNQSKIFMTNTSFPSTSVWDVKWNQKPILFTPSVNKDYSRMFFRKIRGLQTMVGLPADYRFLQRQIALQKQHEEFENLLTVSYNHHLHSEEYSHAPLNTGHKEFVLGTIDIESWFSEKYGRLWENTDGPQGADMHYALQIYGILKDRYSDRLFPNPTASLYAALAFELFYVTKYLHQECVSRRLGFIQSQRYINQCLKYYRDQQNHHEGVLSYYQSAFDEIQKLDSILADCPKADEDIPNKRPSASHRVYIRRNSDSYTRFCKYIDELMRKETSFVLKYILIDMSPLSSGEQALQNIFSWLRLPPSAKEILGQDSDPIQDNVLLLLDEVDLYMHPEWQRKFLKYLSDELSLEYPNKRIQLIISTHSPLVLSDIPSGNIIYLEKNDEKCTIARRPDAGESFGANIFSLLKDSFYLKRSLGEFAHSKIEEVIKELNKLKKNPNDKALRETCRGYKQLIEIIGEPVIKRKLQNLYADLFDTDQEDAHRRDLAELSRLLESGDPAQRDKYRELLKNILSEAKSS